jgi:hypothetical protein
MPGYPWVEIAQGPHAMKYQDAFFYASLLGTILAFGVILFQWLNGLRSSPWKSRIANPLAKPAQAMLARYRSWPEALRLLLAFFLAVLASRLLIFAVGSVWEFYFGSPDRRYFLGAWIKWDSNHYLAIAKEGYSAGPGDAKYRIVFFPLYSLLIKALWFVFRDYTFSGLVISTLSLTASCQLLYRLARIEDDRPAGARAVFFLLASPFSVFLGLIYTESLFLALSLGCFLALKKRRWLVAGMAGFGAALTKNQGILLTIPFFIEAAEQLAFERRLHGSKGSAGRAIASFLPILLIPAGFAAYCAMNLAVTGDPFRFLAYQREHWSNAFGFFAQNIRGMAAQAFSYEKPGYRFTLMILQPAIFLSALAFLFAAARKRISSSVLAYSLAYLVISYSPTWLLSGARYSTALFFIPITLALHTKKKEAFCAWALASSALMAFFTVIFLEWSLL